jgi:hypothetical protein
MGDNEDHAVEEKEEQEEQELTAEEEFDEVFDEVTAEEPVTPASEDAKPDGEGEEKAAEEKAAKEAEEKAAADKAAEDKSDPEKDPEVLEKRLKDTQAALTDKSQELADLKKGADEKDKAKTEEEVMADLDDETKEFIEDYPGFAGAMKNYGEAMVKIALADALTPYKAAIKSLKGELEYVQFERQVQGGYWNEGKYFEGHADSPAIIGRKEFGEFIEAEKVKDPSVETTGSPAKVIDLISRFKETIAKASTEEHDKGAKEKAQEVKDAAANTLGQKAASKESGPKPDGGKDDFDATWDSITQ